MQTYYEMLCFGGNSRSGDLERSHNGILALIFFYPGCDETFKRVFKDNQVYAHHLSFSRPWLPPLVTSQSGVHSQTSFRASPVQNVCGRLKDWRGFGKWALRYHASHRWIWPFSSPVELGLSMMINSNNNIEPTLTFHFTDTHNVLVVLRGVVRMVVTEERNSKVRDGWFG